MVRWLRRYLYVKLVADTINTKTWNRICFGCEELGLAIDAPQRDLAR